MFRTEVIEAKKQKLHGKAIVIQPISLYLVSFICLFFFIIILLYLMNATYSRKETVSGYLVPENGLIKVFSNRPGVIENIYIKDGSFVEKGKELVKIINSQSLTSGVELSISLSRELSIQRTYLKKQLLVLSSVNIKEIDRINHQIMQLNDSLLSLNEVKNINKKKLEIKSKQLRNNKKLLIKGHVSQNQVDLILEQYLNQLDTDGYLKKEINSTKSEIASLKSELSLLPEKLALKKILINSQLSELNSKITELENQYEFIYKAPESGIVTAIQLSKGTHIEGNTPLLSIIPYNSPLEIELLLPTRSSGFVQLNDKVNIRFDAFPYQKFGFIKGDITNIDRALILPSEKLLPIKFNEAMYRVRAKLNSQSIKAYNKEFPLKVGMNAEVDIILENRRLFEWILDPIYAVKGKME